ncbi:MAG TPA: SpaA isopeptide-forming pilin-related protein [Actinokineospora sp.]|nr:SpaA isopeptide-forming pilin-related protein [Actinokineospora sp.]
MSLRRLVSITAVTAMLLPFMTVGAAANVLPGSPPDVLFPNQAGGFQMDGNPQQSMFNPAPPPGSIDWTDVNLPPNPYAKDPVGNLDPTVYDQGSKETVSVEDWTSAGSAGAPQKGDFGNIYFYAQIYDVNPGPAVDNRVFMYFAYERAFNSGSLDMNVELNQLPNHINPNGISVPTRSIGDVRLAINNQGSQNLEISGDYNIWDGTDWGPDVPLASNIVGRLNDTAVPEPYTSDVAVAGQIPLQQFVEFGVDMTGAGIIPPTCPLDVYFGSMNFRSRAAPAQPSELKDFIQTDIYTPSLCTRIRIEKHDAAGALVPGATFLIAPNPDTGTGSMTATDGGANDLTPTGSQAPADGVISFPQAQPGSYTVTETGAPPGYIGDPTPQTKNCPIQGACTFVFVNNLGSLVFHKQDDAGQPLGGATFSLTATGGAAAAPPWDLDTNPITIADCTTAPCSGRDTNAAPGEFTVVGLPTGTYALVETIAPAGYDADPDSVVVTITSTTPFEVVTPFVDPRQVGWVRVVKKLVDEAGAPVTPPNLAALDGATFVIYSDGNGNNAMDPGEQAHLWPNPPADGTDIAACTITGGLGYCDIGPLATGSYRITETVAPANTTSAGDVNVTVTETTAQVPIPVDFTNVITDIDITLDKTGPATANVGDEITYTFTVITTGPRLHNVVLVDDTGVCAATPTYQSGDDGDGFLEPGESWIYTCTHVITMADPDPLPNTATATGTDDFGRDVSDSDDHSVDILYPDLTVLKTGNGPISAGQTATFTITMTVGGDPGSIARSATLDDQLPAGLTWTINPAVTGCSIVTTTLHCDFGDLAVGATRTVVVSAPTGPVDCGTLTNTATVGAGNEPNTGNNSSTGTILVNCPDVTVEKTTDTPTVAAGDTARFTITVTNLGPGTAFGVTLTDPLPAGVAWVMNPAVQGCLITNNILSCDLGTLLLNASVSVTVEGVYSAPECGTLPNTATVGATNEPASAIGNNTSTATIAVNCPDVTVEKTTNTGTISAGDTARFTVTVRNLGPGLAFNVTLTDPLPAGIDWSINPAVQGCSIVNGILSCALGTLAPNTSVVVVVEGVTDAADCGALPNTATVAADNESNTGNNTATATINVNCPDVTVEKTTDAGTINAGDTARFTITVRNNGQGNAYNVTLTDPLPAGSDWTINPAVQGCSITNGTLSCDLGTIAPQGSVVVIVEGVTDAADCGTLPNTATVAADNETNTGNNTATATINVNCSDVTVEKTTDTGDILAGELARFTVTVRNLGPGTAYGVHLTDPLPGDIEWVENPDVTECAIDEGVLTCDWPSIAPLGMVTVTVEGTTPDAVCGELPNTATVSATNETNAENNTASATILVTCLPNIIIEKVADDDTIDAGETAAFTISVKNIGAGPAQNVVMTDELPDGIEWTADNELCEIAEGVLTCEFGTMAPATEHVVHLTGPTTPANCGVLNNTAVVTLTRFEGGESSASITVVCSVDIGIDKSGPTTAMVGDTITYTFTVTNVGQTDLTTVTLTDPICNANTLTWTNQADGDTVLSVGEVWTAACKHTITSTDPDPLPNTATVVGTAADGRNTPPRSDDHLVDLVQPVPAPRPPLATTGANVLPLGLAALVLILMGGVVLALTPKRR